MALSIYKTKKGLPAGRLQQLRFRTLRLFKDYAAYFRRIDRQMVVFEAYHGTAYACSPKAIYEVMLHDPRFKDFTFVWIFKDCAAHADIANNPRTKLITYRSPEYYQVFAQAKYWVVNRLFSLDIAKHPIKQVMVQCFHGTPLKRMRGDVLSNTSAPLYSRRIYELENILDTKRYDFFVSPSRYASEKFISGFNLEKLGMTDIIIETGYPRNDYLINHTAKDVTRIKRDLTIPSGKKVALYAPTWRDDQYRPGVGYTFEPRLNFAELRRQLGDEYVLLFRGHYLVSKTLDFTGNEGFIYDVSKVDDVNELYVISDVLITDYSSVFFDYGNLQRPILFYMYDQVHYQQELRGLYLSPDDLPGDIVTTQGELIERLQNLNDYGSRYQKQLAQFHQTYNYLDDGKAAQRVIDIFTAR